jgi:biopolymer transport protein ExbB
MEMLPMPKLPLSHRPWKGGNRAWALAILWSLAWLAVCPAPTVWSQEPAAKTDAAPAPEPAGAADAAPDAATAPAPTGGAEAPKPTSMLMWAIEASGPIGFCLLLLSIYFTALVIRLFMEFRMTEAVPPALVEKLDTAIKDRKFQEAYDACRDNDSFLARVVRTGVANLPNGRAEAKEAMHDVTEEIVTGMEARISYLAIIGTLGPMIGLVGTIWGMIMSFQVIATAQGAQAKPAEIAEGISTALFITLEGVSLAVPAIYFHALFRNRIAKISMETTKVADRTINSLVAAAKQTKSA